MKLFIADSAKHLSQNLKKYGCEFGQYVSYAFADGERGYRLREKVRGKSVALIASVLPNPESLFEILALHRLVLENGSRKTTAVIPYLGYARQDRPTRPGEGSIGGMVIEILQKMNPSKLVCFDVHSDFIRKAFRPFVSELSALPLIADALAKHPPDVIVSPDAGFVSMVGRLQKLLKPKPDLAVIEKVRPKPNVAIAKHLHGDVRGKDVLIADDMIDTGGTLSEAVKLVFQNGARNISREQRTGHRSHDAAGAQQQARLPFDCLSLFDRALGGNAAYDRERRSDGREYVLADEIDERRHRQDRAAGAGKPERSADRGPVSSIESELFN